MLESTKTVSEAKSKEKKINEEDLTVGFNPQEIPKPPAEGLSEKINKIAAECYVTVMSGSSSKEFPVAKQKVADVRQLLKGPLNIADNAIALVNGKEVAENYVLNSRDRLEFVRRAGSKGSSIEDQEYNANYNELAISIASVPNGHYPFEGAGAFSKLQGDVLVKTLEPLPAPIAKDKIVGAKEFSLARNRVDTVS